MSGWTILTARAERAEDYVHTDHDGPDPFRAQADLLVTFEAEDRVHDVMTWKGHVYAYLACGRYDFEFAEDLIGDYAEMIEDAVVLGANDTSDTGRAKYYPDPEDPVPADEYAESQGEDGMLVGEMALCVINSRNGILARDPFHNEARQPDEFTLGRGVDMSVGTNEA